MWAGTPAPEHGKGSGILSQRWNLGLVAVVTVVTQQVTPGRRVSNGTSGLVVTAWNLLGMAGNSKILKCWVFHGTGTRRFFPSLFSCLYSGKGSQQMGEWNKFQDVGLARVVTSWNHLGLVGNSKILKCWGFHGTGRRTFIPSLFSSPYPGKSSQQVGEWNKFWDVGPWWP